jgi:glycosyltransferase involved in cell wall biosynthesis
MTITVFSSAWNCKESGLANLISYYLNTLKVDKFIYADNHSTDGTIDYLKKIFNNDPRLIITFTPYTVFSDDNVGNLANTLYKEDSNDVFIWVDSDEIIYHPNLRQFLAEKKRQGKYFISSQLTNVFNSSNTFNPDIPIMDNFELCCDLPVQKSPIIIRSDKHKIGFAGGHHCIHVDDVLMEWKVNDRSLLDDIAIFHFCYISADFYIKRKTLAKEHLIEQGAEFPAILPGGWWTFDIPWYENMVQWEKSQSISLTEFLTLRNLNE